MENDASSAGVAHGGLFSTAEIKILICYILSAVDEPIPVNALANMLHFEGIANAFEVSDAVISLDKSGQIKQDDPNGDAYVITDSGRNVAAELNSSLSMTVKERAYIATLKMLARIKNAKETSFEITHEHGSTYLTCNAFITPDKPFISIKMLVSDESSAGFIKEKFLEAPASIYSKIIEMLTK